MIENATQSTKLIHDDSPFAVKEAYVKIRTNLQFCLKSDKSGPCKSFAITSSNPGEGKSTSASNIAISFALLGKKTLLIDADIRKPTQHKIWGMSKGAGLSDYLARVKNIELYEVEGIPLSIITAGTIPPNPSELLSSNNMSGFVEICKSQFEYIIIDTPPVNTVADAQIISTFVDGVVLVVKSASTTKDELKTSSNAVINAGGNLCGVIINETNPKQFSYKYSSGKYGYSSKSYKYGYSNSYGSYGSYGENSEKSKK